MINIRTKQLRSHLDALDVDGWACACGVDTGYTKKIRGRDLLHGFLLMHNHRESSFEHWASCIESFTGRPVSKQAVRQRCTAKPVRFFEQVCTEALRLHIGGEAEAVGPALEPFGRVLVEDSTCVSVPRCLAEAFPSSFTKEKPAATARLQLRVDVKTERTTGFHLGSYRENDQSYAKEILKDAEPGDLVIRDLGYFSLPTLQALADRGSFFLSRLRYGVVIKDPKTGKRINLLKKGGLLKGKERVDLQVQIGEQTPVAVRLVGERLLEERAAERRRKAKKDRHGNANHSKNYMRWLGWNFFVTNVGPEAWSAETVVATYRLRWRIEIVFKMLKSCFQGARQLEKRRLSVNRVKMTIYGWLIYSALIVEPSYRYFAARVARRGGALSLLKYCRWLRVHYVEVLLEGSLATFTGQVAQHCVYDTRHDRCTYHEQRTTVGASKQRAGIKFP